MLFVAVTVVAVGAAAQDRVAAAVAGVVLLATLIATMWAGPDARRIGVVVITAVWMVVVLGVSESFVWVAFPLFFFHLLAWQLPWAIVGLVTVTAAAIASEAGEDTLTSAEVIGPLFGAAVAVLVMTSYRALATEYATTRRALAALEDARQQLADSEHRRGTLEERRRIAREIHDTIAQDLTSILLFARTQPADTEQMTDEIVRTAQHALAEARSIVAALGPTDLETSTLTAALEQLACEKPGPAVTVHVEGNAVDLPSPIETALLRVAQSALANAREHSHADEAHVTLTYLDDETAIDVTDSGVGLDPNRLSHTEHRGFGIDVMRQRIEKLGGTFLIESAPGHGTTVHASIPAAPQ